MKDIHSHFPNDFSDARRKFRSAASEVDAALDAFTLPGSVGAQGEPLSMEVARIGAHDSPNLIVLSSGVHGVEGFAGSGAQVNLLRDPDIVHGFQRHDVSLLLIHAINPYGFSHLRRVNEHSVDLNRNGLRFPIGPDLNPAYQDLHELLVPQQWPRPEHIEKSLAEHRERLGSQAYFQAVTGGQNHTPHGVFYSGTSPAWSNSTLASLMEEYGKAAKRICWIDIHTGLGPTGHGEKLFAGPDEPEAEIQRARSVWGADVVSVNAGQSTSSAVAGPLVPCVYQSCPQATIDVIALEFGTVPKAHMVEAVVADQWLENQRGHAPEALTRQIKSDLLKAFYVDRNDWRVMIYTQVRLAVWQALAAVSR